MTQRKPQADKPAILAGALPAEAQPYLLVCIIKVGGLCLRSVCSAFVTLGCQVGATVRNLGPQFHTEWPPTELALT